MTAALGIILQPKLRTQTIFGGGEVPMAAKNIAKEMGTHTDDIHSIAMSSDRKLVATG